MRCAREPERGTRTAYLFSVGQESLPASTGGIPAASGALPAGLPREQAAKMAAPGAGTPLNPYPTACARESARAGLLSIKVSGGKPDPRYRPRVFTVST